MLRRSTSRPARFPWLIPMAAAVLLLGGTRRASAQPDAVLVARVGFDPSGIVDDAERRIGAELRLEGFRVIGMEPADESAVVERAKTGATIGALILVVEEASTGVEVRSLDAPNGTWVRRRVPLEATADAAAVLTIRAVEILHAHFLERRIAVRALSARSPAPPSAGLNESETIHQPARGDDPKPQAASGPGGRFEVGIGGTALSDAYEQAPTLAAVVSAAWSKHRWGARILAVVPASAATVSAAEGSADMRTSMVLGQTLFAVGRRRVRVQAAIGGGVVRFAVEGKAGAPYQGLSPSFITAAAGAGFGTTLWLTKRVGLVADVEALMCAKAPIIQIAAADRARFAQFWGMGLVGLVFAFGGAP